jgi:CRISPR system Cascade subunit CasA
MAAQSFPVDDRAWLPVHAGGRSAAVGLRELLVDAHRWEDLSVPVPPAAAGLWRILYVLAARVSGLDDPALSGDEWLERRERLVAAGRFDAATVDAYFQRYAGRFDLFDRARPWLQDPRLAVECLKTAGVNKLVLGRPAGNNQVWFGHVTDQQPGPLSSAEAVWWLVAQLFYGPSGRCSSRVVRGESFANSTAGPLRSVVSFHPLGRTVFESLVAGIPAPDTAAGLAESLDACPWEREELPDPLGVPPQRGWPGGLLAGGFRHAVLLVPDAAGEQVTDAYLTWAWRRPSAPVRDPYVIWRQNRQGGWYAQSADADRAVWRDLDALLHHADALRPVDRPQVIDGFRDLPYAGQVRLRALGFDQDGQTRDRQWFAATTPPVLQWLEDQDAEAAQGIGQVRQVAETIAGRLRVALRDAWRHATGPGAARGERSGDGPWGAAAAALYWPAAEREFWRRVDSREFTGAWSSFVRLALSVLDAVTDQHQHNLRFARAVDGARTIIARGPAAPARTRVRSSA